MLMSAAALLKRVPNPTDEDINTYVDNICRCGTYPRVRAAIHRAAGAKADLTPPAAEPRHADALTGADEQHS
jgi:isoquinoline 1-oxidoreductase alpha subunit